jgi:hypothetical protein
MKSQSFQEDPQPDLPDCFCNEAYVEELVKGFKSLKMEGRDEDAPDQEDIATTQLSQRPMEETPAWQPESSFRGTISSLATSDDFGAMLAAEADSRGFFMAKKNLARGVTSWGP